MAEGSTRIRLLRRMQDGRFPIHGGEKRLSARSRPRKLALMPTRLETVEGNRARRRFVRLARRFRGQSPFWVPVPEGESLKLLDPRRNPAFRFARQALWVALGDDGRARGRIGATYDPRHAQSLGEEAGWFGFFDADGPATTALLLDRAWNWLREQGAETMLGPADPDTNHECGCLIEGHGALPYLMMPHHPAAYGPWLEEAGLTKAKDLLAFEAEEGGLRPLLARLRPLARRLLERHGIRLVGASQREFTTFVRDAGEVYNQAWSQNWGFLPMSAAEFAFEAQGLKLLLDPRLACLAYADRRPVGVVVALRDVNVALQRIDGRLFPWGWLRLLRMLPHIDRARTVMLGVVPEHRQTGLAGALVHHVLAGGLEAGIRHAELSWVLEDNRPMLAIAEAAGARLSRRYRIFRRRSECTPRGAT